MDETQPEKPNAAGLRIALVASRFNEFIVQQLVDGARVALMEHGASAAQIQQVWVAGAWELPLALKALAASGRFDMLVALGCVIRGETSHHLYICAEAARGIARVSLDTGVPIGFGVLTTENEEQALARAGGPKGNKGADAALAAVELLQVKRAWK